MFRQLAAAAPTPPAVTAADLVRLHPAELIFLLELAWNNRVGVGAPTPDLGHPDRRSDAPGLPDGFLPLSTAALSSSATILVGILKAMTVQTLRIRWDHLIYAYMIENTRIYDVFRRVVHEFLHGEKLGSPRAHTQLWLRNTEELFFRAQPSFSISTVDSQIRADLSASRRNAYWRMFGMDLNHGTDNNQPYAYLKADAANNEFVSTFEELLREVWIGMTHITATAAARPTDDSKIAMLAEKLHDMLRSRRQYGGLSREEFVFVSMMSWFHLTIEANPPLPVIEDLRVEVIGAEQRLAKIAQRVGLPSHGLSKSYLDIANPISRILIQIEAGTYNSSNVTAIPALYTPGSLYPPTLPGPGPEADMRTIITHWSTITGRDMKARKVAST